MNMKYLAFIALIITGLLSSTHAFAAAEIEPPSEAPAIVNTTRTELLMFFDEKDLVTATKRSTSLRKAPAIATIITAEEIRNMGARNLLDVLKMVPGFGVSINEFGTTMIEVRGIKTQLSEKVLFMIDGHAMNKNFTGSSAWTHSEKIAVENIKQVEVVRGPGSALYGANAFTAIVNIITREAEEINGLELKAGGGNFDTYKGNVTGGKVFGDKFSVAGSLDHSKTASPNLMVGADAQTRTASSLAPGNPDLSFRQTDVFLKLGYGDLTLRGGYKNLLAGTYIGAGHALNENGNQKIDSYWGELSYTLALAEGLSTNIKLKYDHWKQDPNTKILPNGAIVPIPFPPFLLPYPSGMLGKPLVKDQTMGAEVQFDWDVFKNNHLIVGMSYEDMRQYDVQQFANFDPNTFFPLGPMQQVADWNKNVTRKVWAIYIQDEWQIHEKVNLTIGTRYDNYNEFGGTFNPRAGVVWNFMENADLKLLYGSAFRAPNFSELYNINNPVVIGNPNLKPEKIKTYEFGITYRFTKWLAADVNYFYSKIKDLITWDSSAAPAVYANTGQAKTQGVETSFYGAIHNAINWKLQYAYQNPRDSVTGRKLPYVPANRAMASINYAASHHLNLHSDALWTGKRPRDIGDERPDLSAYTTVDLAATVKNVVKNMEWQAAIHNLFNNKFKDPDTSGALNKVPGDFPREGISALLSMTYKF